MIRTILDGLDALRDNPAEKLIRVRAPDDEMQYDLLVPDPDDLYRNVMFTFSVMYSVDEETLHVVHCKKLSSEDLD